MRRTALATTATLFILAGCASTGNFVSAPSVDLSNVEATELGFSGRAGVDVLAIEAAIVADEDDRFGPDEVCDLGRARPGKDRAAIALHRQRQFRTRDTV